MTSNKAVTPFIGSGVKQDLHVLYDKFIAVGSIKIRDFADVFREMRFETLLHYRLSPAEYVEFAEYLLQNAALYFGKENEIHATRSFAERIFGIYTCYAIYSLQPTDHVCQIPVTQSQMRELMEFEKILNSERALEPLAALKNLILKKAFRLTLFQSTYDPTTHKRYLAEEEMPDFGRQPVVPFARVKAILKHQNIGELTYIHNMYIQAKANLGMTDIKMVDRVDPMKEIQKHLEKHEKELKDVQKGVTTTSAAPEEELEVSAGTSRSELRSRAYTAGMKHTRQRRYLDPNMEENFKQLTFGQIAQQCLEEERQNRARALDNRNGKERQVKPELPETSDETIGEKKSKHGTSGVAKIRAPKKKAAEQVEAKSDRNQAGADPSSSDSPRKRKQGNKDTKPRISDEWANKLNKWSGQVKATDKQLKKLTSRIKIEEVDED
ncbi:unnamed protein product [Caenorhabditis sp. 36 PRJEB53466]|nr:unnamed protein product [Caenorhabditis sp. 36 PRJEB53466]